MPMYNPPGATSYLGVFANVAALQAANPAATNIGKHATVNGVDYVASLIGGVAAWLVADAGGSGTYDISTAPGVTVGVLANSAARQANGVALQAAFDYCITAGLIAYAPAGRYEYECTTVQNSYTLACN